MTDVLKHGFVSPRLDGSDPTQIQPSHWNAGHKFVGGNNGDVLVRDTGDPAFGAKFAPLVIPPAVQEVPAGGINGDVLTRDLSVPTFQSKWAAPLPWQSYTPVWAGAGGGTPPTLGNAELSGRYIVNGKWCEVAIVMRLGTTSIVGSSGYWTLTLPIAARQLTSTVSEVALLCGLMDTGSAVRTGMTAYVLHGAPNVVYVATTGGLWGPAQPFAWGPNALITIRGSYETN